MKFLVALAFVTVLAGCGAADRVIASATGYSSICVDGVTYLQFTSGATVKVDPTGKPVACK